MCSGIFGGGSPSVSVPETKEYATTKDATATVTAARDKQKDKAAAALGQMGSIQTSPFGAPGTATTAKDSLLGAR